MLSARRRLLLRQRLRRFTRPLWLGPALRTAPVSSSWGIERGLPVDRWYIEGFLRAHRADIRGRVLEVADNLYTRRFGSAVEQSDILDINAQNPRATIIADLAAADAVPSDSFDCFILTQTLQFLYDVPGGLSHIYRLLKPGGVLLLTVPGISKIDPALYKIDYWRFTVASCRELFGGVFGAANVEVGDYGNALSAVAFLLGLATEELSQRELSAHDPYFPLIIAVRATKRIS